MDNLQLLNLGIYEHYKGKRYEVLGVGKHTETLEDIVVYRALYDSKDFGDHALWIRPYAMFVEHVMIEGNEVPRFRFISSIADYENQNA